MMHLHKTFYRKGRERNLHVYWYDHTISRRPHCYAKEVVAQGYPWECFSAGFNWGRFHIYLTKNTYTRDEIRDHMASREAQRYGRTD